MTSAPTATGAGRVAEGAELPVERGVGLTERRVLPAVKRHANDELRRRDAEAERVVNDVFHVALSWAVESFRHRLLYFIWIITNET